MPDSPSNYIKPLTAVGRTTVFLLRLNEAERVEERIALHIGE